jgi:DNA-binding winged helix-turn-helix (wHTH) protein
MGGTAETLTPAAGTPTSLTRVELEGWTLDRLTGDLWNADLRQRLPEQPRQILDELLGRAGELVTREELIARLWPKVIVDFETSLNTAMRKLRLALGDDPDRPRYIETLPGKGYRFIGRLGPPAVAGAVSSPVAFELYLAAKARQPEISIWEGLEPRERVLELIGRALAIDPSLAPAYVVRARTNFDFFISNLDVSEEILAAVRNDLETACRLSGTDRIGLAVRCFYAAVVDLDPEAGLHLADSAPNDPDVLQTKATILMTLGRYRESDEIFDRFLALDPANQRLLRIKVTNLLVERRCREALELMAVLEKLSPAGRNPRGWAYPMTGQMGSASPSFAQARAVLQSEDADGEHLSTLLPELALLRIEGRYAEIHDLLETSRASLVRVPPLTGAWPGLGRHPVAALRGWNDMLRGDAASAARNGGKVLEFVAAHRATKWNKWHMRMLEAQAQIFMGCARDAVVAVRDSLQDSPHPLANRHMRLYREYLAAITLGWAGEHEESASLLERLSSGTPSLGPAIIAREPLLTVPLRGIPRFERLQAALEREIDSNGAARRCVIA